MVTPGDLQYSFLVNSGTEATEGALKFAKVYAYEKKPDHMLGVISTTRAFHGKSMGSLSVSGKREFRVPFQPLMPGIALRALRRRRRPRAASSRSAT